MLLSSTGDIARWHEKIPTKALNADNVFAASAGKRIQPAPETRRSGESSVTVCGQSHLYYPHLWDDLGGRATPFACESQSGQVKGSAPGRHNIGPDLFQRYGVSLGGPDGEERCCDCGEHQ